MKQTDKILNLGCGERKLKNAVNLDFNRFSKPDVIHNLEKFPYPFRDNQFSQVFCFDVLEHLSDLMEVMQELHRISANGAIITIELPHFSHPNAYADPTHKHWFSFFSFDYFTGENQWSYYVGEKPLFKTVSKHLYFPKRFLSRLAEKFFNKHPKLYESRYAWIYPAEKIQIELETVKAR